MADPTQPTTLDIGVQRIASVYAKGFLGAAQSSGKLPACVAELNSFVADVLGTFPDFERLLGSAFLKHEAKVEILGRTLAGQASQWLLVFLKVVSAHGRLDCLRAICYEVNRQYRQMQGKVDVTVRLATTIDSKQQSEIASTLQRLLGAEPSLNLITDPRLIGGLIVSVGDTVYDGSIATQLASMRSNMIEKSIEQIDTNRKRFLTPSP